MLCTKLVEPLDRPDKKEYTFGMTRQTLTGRGGKPGQDQFAG